MRKPGAARAGRLLVALVALTGCNDASSGPAEVARPAGPTPQERVRVLNADVLVIDGQHVRLADVAAPQPIPDARCWAEALAARQATSAVRDMVRAAREVSVAPSAERDSYDRSVTKVTLDRLDLGTMLVEAGLAATSAEERFSWCEPISRNAAGAPDVRKLMDFSR